MKYLYRILTIIIVCLLSTYIVGCGENEDDSEPTNNSPIVDSFIVPETFDPGDVLEFKVIAYDEDGDPLSYTWEVDGVVLSGETGTSVKWTAPEDVESVKVTVYVSDGISKSTKRVKTITNKLFVPPDPPEVVIDTTPDPPLNSIVPGRGAFGIKLGDPFKKVEELHGDADGPIGVDGFFSCWEVPDLGFSGFVDGIGLVEHIFIDRPNKAKTNGENGVGNALASVQREFGDAEEIDENDHGNKRHWYWKRGIEFTIDDDERVESIYVFKPIVAAPSGIEFQQKQEAAKNDSIKFIRRTSTDSMSFSK